MADLNVFLFCLRICSFLAVEPCWVELLAAAAAAAATAVAADDDAVVADADAADADASC